MREQRTAQKTIAVGGGLAPSSRATLAKAWSRHRDWHPARQPRGPWDQKASQLAMRHTTERLPREATRSSATAFRAKKYGPQPVRTEARECGSGYAMERAVREGDTGLHHTATTRRCLLDRDRVRISNCPQWSVRDLANQSVREHFAAEDTHGWGRPRTSSFATRLVTIGSGPNSDHARTPPDFNTHLTVFSTIASAAYGPHPSHDKRHNPLQVNKLRERMQAEGAPIPE